MIDSNKYKILISDSSPFNDSFKIPADYLNWSTETTKVLSDLSSAFTNYLKSQTNTANQMLKQAISPANLIETAAISLKPFSDTKKLNSLYVQTIFDSFSILKSSLNSLYDLNRASAFYAHDVLEKVIKSNLAPLDFRISIIQQDLDKTFEESPEESLDNLFFKDTSNPANEVEARLFDILNEIREISKNNADILKQIKDSHTKDISNKKHNDSHNPTPFYKNSHWLVEQIFNSCIGIIVTKIYDFTIGVDPHNTLGFVLLFSCLITFISRHHTDT